jgi:hypothetical protein
MADYEQSEAYQAYMKHNEEMVRLAEAPKEPCFTEDDLTERWEKKMAHFGIQLLGWVPKTFENETCRVAVVGTTKIRDGFEPNAATLYTKICMGGRCDSFNGSIDGICYRNPSGEKPFGSYQGLHVHGPCCCGDEMVSHYEHSGCDKKALRIIGNSGEGCFSMPLYIKEGEPIPELKQKMSFEGTPTGYYVRSYPEEETTAEEDEEASKEEDPQTHEEQLNSKKKRSSDVPNPWKGRLRSGIQKKKRPVCGMYKGVR